MSALGIDEPSDRAICRASGIHYCEPSAPWDRSRGGRAYHPEAAEVPDAQESGRPSGDTVRYRCPVCGHSWTATLPQ